MNRALIKIEHRYEKNPTNAKANIYCYIDENGTSIETENLKNKFTPGGTVFWPNISESILVNEYYWTELTETNTDSSANYCNFKVRPFSKSSNLTRAIRFKHKIDGIKLNNESDFRLAFIEEGVPYYRFSGDMVKICCKPPQALCHDPNLTEEIWVGPIELYLDADKVSYKLKPSVTELEIRKWNPQKIFSVDDDGYFSCQNVNETDIIGYINLQSDTDVLNNINDLIYKNLKFLDSTSLDNRTVEALKKRIEAASLLYDKDSLRYKAYLYRVQNLISRIDTIHQTQKDTSIMIDQYIERHEDVDKWRNEFYENKKREIETSLDLEREVLNSKIEEDKIAWDQQRRQRNSEEKRRVTEFKRQLDILSTTIQNKQHELDVKQIELDTLCQKGKVQRQVQEQELLKSLNKIIEEHKPLWDSLTYLQKNSQDIVERKPKKVSSFYWTNAPCPDYKNQGAFNAADILNTIGEHSSYFNIEPTRLKDSLLSLTNSKIPCFTGVTALAAAHALASITASGNYNVRSVPAAAFSVYDLFGTVDSKTGEINESQYNLLSFLHNAHNNPEHVFAVILEGMNRCPLESYLDALAAAYYYAKEKPMAVAPVDKISDSQQILIPQIQWPQNVYLIGTLIRGKTTFKIETDYLEWIDLVDAFSLESSYCEPKSHKVRHDDFILKRIEDDIDKFESTLLVGRDKTNIISMHHLLTCSSQDWNREKQHLSQSDLERIEYNRYYMELQEL